MSANDWSMRKNKLNYSNEEGYTGRYDDYDSYLLGKNKYYQDLETKYPKYFEKLTSGCDSFEEYFKARR